MHRDFHSRNLMLSSPNPGVLDFQDAVHGPLSYDLVSLFKDAYIRWDEDFILDMLARYWDIARKLGLPVRDDFPSSIAISNGWGPASPQGAGDIRPAVPSRRQGRLPQDMPLVMDYLRRACERYVELAPWRDC